MGQTKEVVIKDAKFKFVTTKLNDTLQKDFIVVYKAKKKVLEHTIYHSDGDCSSENLQLGTYEIKGAKIILYSYWAGADRMGKNMYPFGYKKQTYIVNSKGTIALEKSIIYVEDYVDSYEKPKAINYLYQTPKNAKERNELKRYVAEIEKIYEGNFVTGKELDKLAKEVNTKLKSEIKEHTSSWKEIYGVNCKL